MPTMDPFRERIEDFLNAERLVVLGLSPAGGGPDRALVRALVRRGYEVLPVVRGPRLVEGRPCLPSLDALDGPVDGAVLVVDDEARGAELVRACEEAGVHRLWFHGPASDPAACEAALALCEELGLEALVEDCCLALTERGWGHAGTRPQASRRRSA